MEALWSCHLLCLMHQPFYCFHCWLFAMDLWEKDCLFSKTTLKWKYLDDSHEQAKGLVPVQSSWLGLLYNFTHTSTVRNKSSDEPKSHLVWTFTSDKLTSLHTIDCPCSNHHAKVEWQPLTRCWHFLIAQSELATPTLISAQKCKLTLTYAVLDFGP